MRKLSVDHIGWAVNSIEKSLPAMKVLGFEPLSEVCEDASRSVRILLLRGTNGDTVELVEPMENAQTPISNFLAKNGPSPYHCCFAADRGDLDGILEDLKESLLKNTTKPVIAYAEWR